MRNNSGIRSPSFRRSLPAHRGRIGRIGLFLCEPPPFTRYGEEGTVEGKGDGERLFTGGGELARSCDGGLGGDTLGPVEGWALSLRTPLDICLGLPMLLVGPGRHPALQRLPPRLGDKHPRSLGQSGPECWREIWPVIGPLYDESAHQSTVEAWLPHELGRLRGDVLHLLRQPRAR
jgi:hypothetical protein